MEKMTQMFIWWFLDRTTRVPQKEDKENLRYKIQNNPKQIELNISKCLDDYVLAASIVGITVDKKQITPIMLVTELKKYFTVH